MRIKPLKSDLRKFLTKHNLIKKFHKQSKLFIQDTRYPSLNTERLEPKHLKIYSFRIDRKYRAIFIFTSNQEVEIIDINLHYQ